MLDFIPSACEVIFISADETATQSFPLMAFPTEFIFIVPPVIVRSSFEVIPSLKFAFIFKVPVPFNVRLSLLKITASELLSDEYSFPSESVFSESGASVINVLSDFSI